jgi:hypothetical protein
MTDIFRDLREPLLLLPCVNIIFLFYAGFLLYGSVISDAFENGCFSIFNRLCLTLSHQYLSQLSTPIRDAVLGNVGSLVVFRIGAEDAQVLARENHPSLKRPNQLQYKDKNGSERGT